MYLSVGEYYHFVAPYVFVSEDILKRQNLSPHGRAKS